MSNKYAGFCRTCAAPVAAGAGECRREGRRWAVYCFAHSSGQADRAPAVRDPGEVAADIWAAGQGLEAQSYHERAAGW